VKTSASRGYNATLIAIVVAYFFALYYFRIGNRTEKLDFGDFYTWAYAARIGLNPYSSDAVGPLARRLGVEAMRGNYPPPFVLALEPLSLLPRIEAFLLWHGLNLCLLLIAIWLLVADLDDSRRRVRFACAALLYGPVTAALFWGQVEPFVLLMLVIALRNSVARRDIACGIAVGLAALCKMYPLVVIGYFLLCRRWTVVASTGLTILGGILLSMLAFNGKVHADFTHQLWRTAGEKFWPYAMNTSLSAVVAKSLWILAGENFGTGLKMLRIVLIVVVASVVLAITIRGTLSAKRRGEESIGFGLWVAATVLLTPIVWPHYLTILLIPLRQVLGDIQLKNEPAFRLAIYSFYAAEIELLLDWFGIPLLPHYWVAIQIAIASATFVAVLLAFAAAYARASGGVTPEPVSNARNELGVV
jgi:hypothetical protein